MPSRQRARVEPTDEWDQLRLQLTWPEHHSYELIRPVVLFGQLPKERALATGIPPRTICRLPPGHPFRRVGDGRPVRD